MKYRLDSLTCDNEALVIIECLCEETRHDELRVYEEPNFFLNKTSTNNSSSYKLVGKIHLKDKVRPWKIKKKNIQASADPAHFLISQILQKKKKKKSKDKNNFSNFGSKTCHEIVFALYVLFLTESMTGLLGRLAWGGGITQAIYPLCQNELWALLMAAFNSVATSSKYQIKRFIWGNKLQKLCFLFIFASN